MSWFEVDIYKKCVEVDLHAILKRGELDRWVDKDLNNHRFDEGSLLLALRPNPAPVDGDWKEMPGYEYRL